MMPYYRVIFDAEPGKPDTDDRIFAAFFDNHTPLEWMTTEANNKSWSTSFMTFEEVQELRSKVRPNYGRKTV
jgi:hypothetical protein